MSRPSSKALLARAGVPALLVSDLTNIRYLTGLEATSALLLAQPKHFMLFVDARYHQMARRRATGAVIQDIGTLPGVLRTIPVCGIESGNVTLERFGSWKKKFKGTTFRQTSGAVEEFRRRKSAEELRLLRRARSMTVALLRRVPSLLQGNVTEDAVAKQLLIMALEMGADGLSFDPIVAFGTHSASPHHRPTSRKLQMGHVVQIDIGVRYKGYCADMSEVYFTAPPTAFQKMVYTTLKRAKKAAMDAVKPGVTNHALDQIARAVLKEQGMEQAFTHALGHGVGLDVHEGITLSSKASETALLRGEIVAIEPGAYFAGKWGMRVEDMRIAS